MFEMRYFYCCDQVDKKYFQVIWTPGLENLADYLSKHHTGAYHKAVRPIYLHCENSPRVLQRAPTPQERREQKLTLDALTRGKKPFNLDRAQAGPRTQRTPAVLAATSRHFVTTSLTPPCLLTTNPFLLYDSGHLNGLRGCVERIVGSGAGTPRMPACPLSYTGQTIKSHGRLPPTNGGTLSVGIKPSAPGGYAPGRPLPIIPWDRSWVTRGTPGIRPAAPRDSRRESIPRAVAE